MAFTVNRKQEKSRSEETKDLVFISFVPLAIGSDRPIGCGLDHELMSIP